MAEDALTDQSQDAHNDAVLPGDLMKVCSFVNDEKMVRHCWSQTFN